MSSTEKKEIQITKSLMILRALSAATDKVNIIDNIRHTKEK